MRVTDYKTGEPPRNPSRIIIAGGAELQRALYAGRPGADPSAQSPSRMCTKRGIVALRIARRAAHSVEHVDGKVGGTLPDA